VRGGSVCTGRCSGCMRYTAFCRSPPPFPNDTLLLLSTGLEADEGGVFPSQAVDGLIGEKGVEIDTAVEGMLLVGEIGSNNDKIDHTSLKESETNCRMDD